MRLCATARTGLVIGALASLLGVGGCGGSVEPPSSYTQFISKDGAFAIDYPDGWEATNGSRPDNTYSWAQFSKGSATIRVVADTAGSLMADVAKAFGAGAEMDESSAPVAGAHESKRDLIAQDFSNYHEGPPRAIQTKLGDTRIAKFAADGSLKGKIIGFRTTMLTNNRRITVLCHCPAAQFEALQPAFETVILSVKRG